MRREQSGTCIHRASWSHIHVAVTAMVHSAVIHLNLADVWSLNMNGEVSKCTFKRTLCWQRELLLPAGVI